MTGQAVSLTAQVTVLLLLREQAVSLTAQVTVLLLLIEQAVSLTAQVTVLLLTELAVSLLSQSPTPLSE